MVYAKAPSLKRVVVISCHIRPTEKFPLEIRGKTEVDIEGNYTLHEILVIWSKTKGIMKANCTKKIIRLYLLFRMFLFDPIEVVNKIRALPVFVRNMLWYNRLNHDKSFKIHIRDIYYTSYNRYSQAGRAKGHYFYQDIWAAKELYNSGVRKHVDVGSRVDGFISHVLPFCRVCYVDIRPLKARIEGFEFRQGSILEMPFSDNSVPSLSCLHVIEHIGLGRYGDSLNPQGYLHAAEELTRVLAPGGKVLLGTPVGQQRLCFDAHRIFDPQTVVSAFRKLKLVEFSLIDDSGECIICNASMEEARRCSYGCGLFIFEKHREVADLKRKERIF